MNEKDKQNLYNKENIQREKTGVMLGMVVSFIGGIVISSFVWVGILIFLYR